MKFIINLSGKLLCPYQMFIDIAEQMPLENVAIKRLAFAPICELNNTNDWINLESLGKPAALRSKTLSDILIKSFIKNNVTKLELDIYLSNVNITADNLYTLLFIAQTIEQLEINFFNSTDSSFEENLKSLFEINNVKLKFHHSIPDLTTDILNDLQQKRTQLLQQIGIELNEALFNGNDFSETQVNQVIGYAWMCLYTGAKELACNLLEVAKSKAENIPQIQEKIFMQLLIIKFYSHQYETIAQTKFPETFLSLSESEIKTLEFLTAYSATLSRHLDVANEFFDRCGINKDMPLTDEQSLYKLNLFALSRVLNKETDLAFELEFRIKDFIEQHKISTVGLKYVNYINIARLFKKEKDYATSLKFYNDAYAEIEQGGFATSDHIYYNMNLGSLYEAEGKFELALQYWMKSAMHWLASPNQYELSWRPRIILCQESIVETDKPLPIEKANQFFIDKLKFIMQNLGEQYDTQIPKHLVFVECSQNLSKESCYINKHIVLFTTSNKVERPRQHVTSTESQLSGIVFDYLQKTMGLSLKDQYIMVDVNQTTKAHFSKAESLAYAQFYGCNACCFEGKWLMLNDALQDKKGLHISLSNLITSFELTKSSGLRLNNKRSFLNKTLIDPNQIELVNALKAENILAFNALPMSMKNVVGQLVSNKVINLSYQSN